MVERGSFIDVPKEINPQATIKFTEAPSMHPDMFYPLLVMIVGMYCFYALVLILFTRAEIVQREKQTQWVKALGGAA